MKMQAQTGKAARVVAALGIALIPAPLMADGLASAAVEDMAVAQYAPGEKMWCPEMEAAVPAELHRQMNCTTVATGFARDAVAGVRITNRRPGGLREFFRSFFQPSRPRTRLYSDDDGDGPRPRLATGSDDGPGPTSPDAPGDVPEPTSPEQKDSAPKPTSPKPDGGAPRPTSPEKGRTKGDNGWGNGPDTTNPGSLSGGTAPSKSTNGKSREDKNYSSTLDKFEGR